MSILVLQHERDEGAGLLDEIFARRRITTRVVRLFAGEPVPLSFDASALVVLGGGSAVYEADAQIRDELRLIERAVAANAPVLGICFGSQLVANALGARVYASGRQEIGWYEVTLEDAAHDDPLFSEAPRSFTPFHWHGDTFDLPAGATLLARSAMTAHQAFRLGRAWGIQFHPEVTPEIVEGMLRSNAAPNDARDILARSRAELSRVRATAMRVLERFVDEAQEA